jgi:hypothetical protein
MHAYLTRLLTWGLCSALGYAGWTEACFLWRYFVQLTTVAESDQYLTLELTCIHWSRVNEAVCIPPSQHRLSLAAYPYHARASTLYRR